VRIPVHRPLVTETTALGAAYLAGLQMGIYASPAALASQWQQERAFLPVMTQGRSEALYQGWLQAVARVRSPAGPA
jgi:glycerol kinase